MPISTVFRSRFQIKAPNHASLILIEYRHPKHSQYPTKKSHNNDPHHNVHTTVRDSRKDLPANYAVYHPKKYHEVSSALHADKSTDRITPISNRTEDMKHHSCFDRIISHKKSRNDLISSVQSQTLIYLFTNENESYHTPEKQDHARHNSRKLSQCRKSSPY